MLINCIYNYHGQILLIIKFSIFYLYKGDTIIIEIHNCNEGDDFNINLFYNNL